MLEQPWPAIPAHDLLRVATAGSVDDGKSTLIGRLLYETQAIFADHLAEVERASQRQGDQGLNLALLTDGLRAERTQGITIDVAYRFFATEQRRFILADTPGHAQYTRNMVTGMSTADVAIVLLDVTHGITEQTRRHTLLTALLQVPHLIFCINKMDLVDYAEEPFRQVEAELQALCQQIGRTITQIIPTSSLHGENVTKAAEQIYWYTGETLLQLINTLPAISALATAPARYPIQLILRQQGAAHQIVRTYAGTVASGIFHPGDAVVLLPTGLPTTIRTIASFGDTLTTAVPAQSVGMTLTDDLDVARGDMLCPADQPALVSQELSATLCWFVAAPLQLRGRYLLKQTTRTTKAIITALHYRLDISTLQHDETATTLGLNDIGRIQLHLATPLCYDPYTVNRLTGSFILIDEQTNETVAAGMIQADERATS